MKVIFMGTPEFAVPTLARLINSKDHQVTGVFTQIAKAKNRGLDIIKSPIHYLASQHNIQVYTPSTLKNDEVISLINSIEADVIVVVAYGFLIPEAILRAKKYGCLNVHPSSLPRHRGAAPLQYTIMAGDSESSVCIMQMDEGFDTGDIILQQKFPIPSRITLPILHDQAALLGADLLVKTLDNIDILPRIAQNTDGITYAHKLTKEHGRINWHEAAYNIDCKIRGMNPWPGVYFSYKGKIIKVLEAEYSEITSHLPAGTIISDRFEVACGRGSLIVKKLQQEGKKALDIEEFLRGTSLPIGALLE